MLNAKHQTTGQNTSKTPDLGSNTKYHDFCVIKNFEALLWPHKNLSFQMPCQQQQGK